MPATLALNQPMLIQTTSQFKTVYRYEDSSGTGPYCEGKNRDFLPSYHTSRHPFQSDKLWCEYMEATRNKHAVLACCFATMRQLCCWFNQRERRLLRKRGWHIRRYRVAAGHYWFDDRQGVFDKAHATLVQRRSK